MHILYIHQHFATPKGSTGTRSYEFARRWVKRGHKVTVITGHYDIGGLELGKGLIQKQTIDQINVVVVGTQYSNKQSFLRRIISFFSFCVLSIYAGLSVDRVDVIYATSTPLTVGIPAIVLKWLKHIPFVFEVRDQWPELPIELGIIRNRFFTKMLLWLESTIYKKSAAIVALSPGMAEGIRQVIGQGKSITVIPNSCDTDLFRPDINGSIIRKKYGWGNKFLFLHAGAMSKINNLDFAIDAAVRLKEHSDIMFVLIGDGNQRPAMESRVRELDAANVEILPSVPKQKLPEIYAAIDAGLMIIGNYPILENNSANKFFDSLSAGKPVLLNYSGWQRQLLEAHNAGFGGELCNLEQFVDKVLYLNSNREQLEQMGRNARGLAEEKFNRDILAKQALEVLKLAYEKQCAPGADAND
jgi:glycosyltransferase involved in cell wall biosynthesis